MTAIVNETVSVKKKAQRQAGDLCLGVWQCARIFDFGVYNFCGLYQYAFLPPSADHNVALLLAFATFGVSFYASARWDYRWCTGRSLRA